MGGGELASGNPKADSGGEFGPHASRPSLVLVGMMGAGKSDAGARVASRLGLDLIDTDVLVEAVAGLSIPDIFRLEGEAGFRRRERSAVADACSQGGRVIATGGGAVLDPANRERLWRVGLVVWLDAPPRELAQRLQAGGDRPLLGGAAPSRQAGAVGPNQADETELTRRLASLLAARRELYARAHRRVETAGRAPLDVAEEVVRLYQQWLDPGVQWVPVNLGDRSYSIAAGPGLLRQAGVLVRQALGYPAPASQAAPVPAAGPVDPAAAPSAPAALPRVLVVTAPPVQQLWLDALTRSLEAEGFPVQTFLAPDGEDAKTLDVLARAYDACAAAGLDRRSVVVALGGGAVGDLAGLVAATYLRGLAFVQVPTTLLAQVDASVGGKVAVNHPHGKNLIGAFHQPRLVLADTETLSTLPLRQIRSGLAEVIKHGVIADPAYLTLVEERLDQVLARDPAALAAVVAGSCRIKAAVVEADERESGLRANLNYGHTVGHALEAAAGFSGLLHGEAVGLGMLAAARLGALRGWAPGLEERLTGLLGRAGLPLRAPGVPLAAVLQYLQADKKASGGRLTWVLARRSGEVTQVRDVDLEPVRDVLLGLGVAP